MSGLRNLALDRGLAAVQGPRDITLRGANKVLASANFTLTAEILTAGDVVLYGGTAAVNATLDTAVNIINTLAAQGIILGTGDTIAVDIYNGNTSLGAVTPVVAAGITADANLAISAIAINTKRTIYLTVTSVTVNTAYGTGAKSGLAPAIAGNYASAASMVVLVA